MHARRPLLLVVLSLVVFLVLDNAIFRTGLYAKVSSSKSVAGHFAAVVRWQIAAPPSAKRDVLVLGHSKIEAAFSGKVFEQEYPDSHLRLVFGSSGGTTEKMWFYLLRHIDPDRRRYAAIVVPVDVYQTPAMAFDADNQIDVAQCLAPMLTPTEWVDLIGTYDDPTVRSRVILGAAVSSHLYALDLQDLLLHPVDRWRGLEWERESSPTYLYNWDGYDGDLETLEIDRASGKILHAPPHLDAFRIRETEARFEAPPVDAMQWTMRYHAFRREWFTRILDYYAGSETKLIFVQVPRWPFLMPVLTPLPDAPNLRDFIKPSKNVIVRPEEEFEDLEDPYYFYDVLHVNYRAREEFTIRFGMDLREALGDL
jgi:hypothetical protein